MYARIHAAQKRKKKIHWKKSHEENQISFFDSNDNFILSLLLAQTLLPGSLAPDPHNTDHLTIPNLNLWFCLILFYFMSSTSRRISCYIFSQIQAKRMSFWKSLYLGFYQGFFDL